MFIVQFFFPGEMFNTVKVYLDDCRNDNIIRPLEIFRFDEMFNTIKAYLDDCQKDNIARPLECLI